MAAGKSKRIHTVILSADVEGYSRLMKDDEEATFRTLNLTNGLLFSLCKEPIEGPSQALDEF
jgi:hypothetical protein